MQFLKMVSTVLFLSIILSLFSGCAAGPQVVDNTFTCGYPKLKVRVADEFSYCGDIQFQTKNRYRNPAAAGSCARDSRVFLFMPKSKPTVQINKFAEIGIESVATVKCKNVSLNLCGNASGLFECGVIELGGEPYQYSISLCCIRNNDVYETFFTNHGIQLPQYFMQIVLARLIDIKTESYLGYYEDIAISLIDVNLWRKDKTKLSETEKKYLEDFKRRALASFSVE